jgi:hypothetical protein
LFDTQRTFVVVIESIVSLDFLSAKIHRPLVEASIWNFVFSPSTLFSSTRSNRAAVVSAPSHGWPASESQVDAQDQTRLPVGRHA